MTTYFIVYGGILLIVSIIATIDLIARRRRKQRESQAQRVNP